MQHRGVAVVVKHRLVLKVGVIILCIEGYRAATHRNVKCGAHTAVPRLFHLQRVNHQRTARGQQVVVLRQRMRGSVALAGRCTQRHPVGGHPLQVESRGDICTAVARATVYPQTAHGRQSVGGFVGVLHVSSRRDIFSLHQVVLR